MIPLLLHLLLNPYALGGIVVLALIAAGIYFTLGPATLLKIAVDIRTWFAIAAVLAVLAFAHQEQANADLKAQLAQQGAQATATTDGAKTTQLRVEQKTQRTTQASRIQRAITTAKPGDAQDAVMDEIAAEQIIPTHTLKVTHAPTQVSVDRAPVPAADGLRKRPDVVVVP